MASIASLIVNVAADTAELRRNLDKGIKSVEGFASSAQKFLGGIAIGAVVKDALDAADALTKMSDKTGIGVVALQQLEAAGIQGGNSLEEIIKAVSTLQVNLAGGDKGVVKALDMLGLSLTTLRNMDGDQAFMEIGKAIEGIQNPMDQAKIRMVLFGKSGNDLAGTLKQDFAAIAADGTYMSASVVASLDAAGDKLGSLSKAVKNTVATWLVGLAEWIGRITDAIVVAFLQMKAKVYGIFADLAANAAKFNLIPGIGDELKKYADEWRASATTANDQVKLHIQELLRLKAEADKVPDAAKKAGGALLDFGNDSDEAAKKAAAFAKSLDGMAMQERLMAENVTQEFIESLGKTSEAFYELGGYTLKQIEAFDNLLESGNEVPPMLDRMRAGVEDVSDGFGVLDPTVGDFPDKLRRVTGEGFAASGMFSGMIDILGTLGRVAEMAGNKTLSAIIGIGQAAMQGFKTGGAWGAIIGGVGGILSGFGSKLFKTEGKQVNDLRDQFIAAQGGLHALNVTAHEVGMTLDALLRADTVKEYEAAVAALTTKFEEQNVKLAERQRIQGEIAGIEAQIAGLEASKTATWADVNRIAQEYGITLDQLGEKAKQSAVNEEATKILDSFNKLKSFIGDDIGGALSGMSDEISKLVTDAAKMGVDVPENMRPLIEALIAQGELLDGNGQKITDITKIKFGAPVETENDKITKAIQELIGKLDDLMTKLTTDLVGDSAEAAAKVRADWARAPWADWQLPTFPDGIPGPTGEGGGRGPIPTGESYGGGRGPVVNVVIKEPVFMDNRESGQKVAEFVGAALMRELDMAGARWR